jgi:predicted nucleic-acid-binding Zn-ribbon protein
MMSGPIIIDHPPKQPRLRDSTSIPIEPEKLTTFFDQGWSQDVSLFCKDCGNPSYKEDGGQRRHACRHCRYVTFYPDMHFSPVTSTSHM